MGRALSPDLRERILAMILSGSSCRGAARHFGVGESTAIRLLRLYRSTGGVVSRQGGGRLGSGKLEGLRGFILEMVQDKPDLTLREISSRIFEHKGVKASVSCVWLLLSREKISYKKNTYRQ